MNRLSLFLALAAGLALIALVLGPRSPVLPTWGPPAVSSQGALSLAARSSHPVVTPDQREVFATVSLTGTTVEKSLRRPVQLALVLDRSGSMAGEKLANAKLAAAELIRQLHDEDTLALIHYGSDVKVFPSRAATATAKEAMLREVEGIEDEGGTNIGAALLEAQAELMRNKRENAVQRILLVSDGEPTEGMTEPTAIAQLTRSLRQEGLRVSAIGVGTDFNEDLMSKIAETGAGSYGYLRDTRELAGLFRRDLEQASTLVARDVDLSFELPEGVELGEVLGYAARQEGRTVHVPMTDFAAGQNERVVARLVVHAPRVGATFTLARVRVRYGDLLARAPRESGVDLTATVASSNEDMVARQDKDATVEATRAMSARNLELAADSMGQGNRGRAVTLLQENEALMEKAESIAGAPALQADRASAAMMASGLSSASSADDLQDAVKSAKKAARKGYGRLGSTY